MIPFAVRAVVNEANRGAGYIPRIFCCPLRSILLVRQLWKWNIRISSVYSNRNNFVKLIGGGVVYTLLGRNSLVRIAARCVLVAKRTVEYRKQHMRFAESCRDLYEALRGRFWYDVSNQTMLPNSSSCLGKILSPASAHFCKLYWGRQCERIKRIGKATLRCFKEGFFLSMRLMDLIEAFSCPDSEAVSYVFINASDLIQEYINNKDLLKQKFNDYKTTICNTLQTSCSTHLYFDIAKAL